MKFIFEFTSSIAAKARALIAQAEAATEKDPEMSVVAGLVYVGDIYSLRDGIKLAKDDGWGTRCYTCDCSNPLL